MYGLAQPDLKVSVQQLAAEGDPGDEHVQRHQTHRLPVHEEPVGVGGGQVVGGAGVHNPPAHLLPGPLPRITGKNGRGCSRLVAATSATVIRRRRTAKGIGRFSKI